VRKRDGQAHPIWRLMGSPCESGTSSWISSQGYRPGLGFLQTAGNLQGRVRSHGYAPPACTTWRLMGSQCEPVPCGGAHPGGAAQGRVSCKQQGICRDACARGDAQPCENAIRHRRFSKGKAARRRPMARGMSLSCERPGCGARRSGLPDLRIKKPISGRPEIGARFQVWIFSYHILSGLANLTLSRFMLGRCSLSVLGDHSSLGGKPYLKFPQKRWMRSQASCSAVVAVA
jgi:hypothetical protein